MTIHHFIPVPSLERIRCRGKGEISIHCAFWYTYHLALKPPAPYFLSYSRHAKIFLDIPNGLTYTKFT